MMTEDAEQLVTTVAADVESVALQLMTLSDLLEKEPILRDEKRLKEHLVSLRRRLPALYREVKELHEKLL